MTDPNHCPFLGLPTELRLAIYEYALLDRQAITIGSAELVGAHPDIVHRLYGNNRAPLPGLPQKHEAIISSHYDATLLGITNPLIIPLTPLTAIPPESGGPHETHAALLSTNKHIREELRSHFNVPTNRKTSLFLSYPHGLHVLSTSALQLVRQARSVHIAGAYLPRTFDPQRAARLGYAVHVPGGGYHGGSAPDHAGQLGTLIASLFGPDARPGVKKLELRIYYPGPDSYSTVWGDDSSPTVIALRNVFAGEVTIEVWRGRWGTAVYMYVSPNQEGTGSEGERKGRRVVSTVWRRLEEGRRGEKDCGSGVVDPSWPEWKECGDFREDEGCVVSAVHLVPRTSSS